VGGKIVVSRPSASALLTGRRQKSHIYLYYSELEDTLVHRPWYPGLHLLTFVPIRPCLSNILYGGRTHPRAHNLLFIYLHVISLLLILRCVLDSPQNCVHRMIPRPSTFLNHQLDVTIPLRERQYRYRDGICQICSEILKRFLSAVPTSNLWVLI
jgi:hypothetical protein